MPEIPSTPAAASSSSPAPSSAPASSPSSSPAPAAAAPAAAPPAAAPPPADKFAGKSVLESVKEISKEAIADAAKAKEPTPVAAPAAEAVKPAAAPAAEPAATEPSKEKVDAAAVPSEEDAAIIPEEDLTLAEMGLLAPTELGDEKWKAFLDANPDEKSKLAYTLRKAADFAKVAALGIGTERQAKFVLGQTQLMADIEGSLTTLDDKVGGTGVDGYTRLVGIMGALDVLRDEETGEAIKDVAGNYQRHGFIDKFLLRTGTELLNSLEQEAEASQDPTLLAAVRTVKERITRTSSASDEDLTEHQKAEAERIRQDRVKLDSETQKAKTDKRNQVETTARENSIKDLDGAIGKFLGKTALDAFAKEVVVGRARTAFYERIEKDPVFRQQRDYLVSQPQTKEVLAERRALARDAMATYLPGIMRAELKRAGAVQSEKAAAADTTRTAQEAASRHEVKGGGGLPLPAAEASQDPAARQAELEKAFVQQNNRKPSMRELTSLILKDNAARRAATGR